MELIQRCQAGDPDAFALLFDRYKNLVYRTAFLILSDSLEAEDALQEVFLKVHGSLLDYQPAKGAFTTWLYRITVNHCLNLRRRRLTDLLSWEADLPGSGQAKAPSAEAQAEDTDVRRAMQGLSPRLRAVVVLHYYCGLTYAEVSQVLGVPIGTVESRMNQAIKNIRSRVDIAPACDRVVPEREGNR